jgi:hypothetical protein
MAENKERNPYIDFLKGILILFVIIGHLLTGNIRTSFFRYAIYAFHMPLFIALTGYLIRPESLVRLSFSALFRKYFHRLLLPWLIALQVFYFVNHLTSLQEFSFMDYLSSYLDIYFHLWYVPALMFWILLTWGFLKLFSKNPSRSNCSDTETEIPFLPLLLAAFFISLIFCIWYILPLQGVLAEKGQYLVYHDLHLLYYIYFVFGMYLRRLFSHLRANAHPGGTSRRQSKQPQLKNFSIIVLLACGSFLLYLLLFPQKEQPVIEHALKFVFNLNLATLILWLVGNRNTPSPARKNHTIQKKRFSLFPWICSIGQHSMAYYLYVQIGKALLIQFVSWKESHLFYTFGVIGSSLLIMGILALMMHFPFFRKYLSGEMKG